MKILSNKPVTSLLACLFLLGGCGDGQQFLSLGTAGTGGIYYPLGGALANRMSLEVSRGEKNESVLHPSSSDSLNLSFERGSRTSSSLDHDLKVQVVHCCDDTLYGAGIIECRRVSVEIHGWELGSGNFVFGYD